MAFDFGKDDESISSINITPFVDIILVVLIIFMLATPVIMNPGIKINLPQAASGESTTPSQITVSIDKSGGIFINGKALSQAQLKNEVTELVKANPDAQAVLAADKDVPHGTVIRVLDEIKSAGIKKFAISIQKK